MIKWLIIFAVGAVAGTIGDYAHFSQGIDGYPPGVGPLLPGLGLPIWVPPLFGVATLLIAGAQTLVRRRFHSGPARFPSAPKGLLLLVAGASFFLLYVASAFLPPKIGAMKDLILFCGATAMGWAFDGSGVGVTLALAVAFTGTAVEATLVGMGVFYYLPSSRGLVGVPTWLPWLYVGASAVVACLIRSLGLSAASKHSGKT